MTNKTALTFPYKYPTFVPTAVALLADGKAHIVVEIRSVVAEKFSLTAAQLSLMHRSTNQPVFVNKIANILARLVMRKAAVQVEEETQAYRITPHGTNVFEQKGMDVRIEDF